MHVPGWHEATKGWQEAGDLQMVGIIQEQHPDRARLFMQWKRMDWPILVDSLNLLETTVVPLTLAIDEHGVVRQIQPPRDQLDAFRSTFVDADFGAPAAAGATQLPPMSSAAARAVRAYLWENEEPDAVINAFEDALAAEPADGYTLFRTGVAYRWRHDSPAARSGDFQRAVWHWERALDDDPNNYIWRRRIQQYGPRLDKPYPFYDWVPSARQEILARGEEPSPLVVEPRGAEFASPQRRFAAAAGTAETPRLDDRIYRDHGEYIIADATLVPSSIAPGATTRVHVTFTPNEAIKAHWNNEVDDLVFWVELPEGWEADRHAATVANPPEVVSLEPRSVEVEIRAPDDAPEGPAQIAAHALYYVCEDVNGLCLYRGRDLTLTLDVRR